MRGTQIIILLTVLVLVGCSKSTQSDVSVLRESLPLINTPLKLPKGLRNLQAVQISDNATLDKLHKKFENRRLPFSILGKIFDTQEYLAILGQIATSSGTPVLVIFDRDGNQIDSLVIYHDTMGYHADSSRAFESYNYGTIFPDQHIQSTDSLVEWEVDFIQGVPMSKAGSQKYSTEKRQYRILNNGMIERL